MIFDNSCDLKILTRQLFSKEVNMSVVIIIAHEFLCFL